MKNAIEFLQWYVHHLHTTTLKDNSESIPKTEDLSTPMDIYLWAIQILQIAETGAFNHLEGCPLKKEQLK